jgi:IclR family pca regulon transcriptional regulator
VARSNSARMVSIGFPVGARVPAHVVTPGPAILSTYSEARLSEWLAQHEFSAFTPRTTTDPATFLRDVLAARELGYWVTEQQLTLGLRGMALPVKDRKGECVGAIGTTMPMALGSRDEVVRRLLPRLQETVQVLRDVL